MTAVLLAGWLSLALEGCAGRQAPQKRYLRIGVVMYDVNDTFLSELIARFREDAKSLQTEERSINVTVRDGEKSQRTEDSCVEELIDGGCDVLCINLVDRTAPSRIIDMALGAIDALRQAGITEGSRPAVFGIDGTKEGLQAIVDGTMAGTVYHDKEGQAMTMAKLAAALYDGEDLSSFHLKDGTYCYLPYQKVTPENLEKFLER